ncbi:MAG: DNA polymerase Y family protein [Sphingomonas sp.]
MRRVAALYLPQWPIERLRRAERTAGPPEARTSASLDALRERAMAEAGHAGSVPRGGGWRPGARWAREDQLGHVAPLPAVPSPPAGEGALVTSLRIGNRVEIAAACPQAQALGLVPGMAVTQARAQVRGIDIRPADPEGDRTDLQSLATMLAQRWCPIVAMDSTDGLLLDLTGTAHLFGGEGRMARRLIRLLARHGFTARIAIADTVGAAHALARYTLGGLCLPGQQARALAELPVAALRIEERAVELLKRLGVERIGALAAMPRAPLARRFGKELVLQLERALGHLPEPLDPVVPSEPIAVEQRFAEPIATPEAIAHWLGELVPRLVAELAQAGLGARRIELVADRIDGVPQRISIGLARPNRDPAHLLRLLTRRIEEIEPGYGVDAMTLHLRRAAPLGPEPVTERLDEEAAPDLAPLVDTLATRIGLRRLWRNRPVESDVPERSVARAPVLDAPMRGGAREKIDRVAQLDRSPALHPWHPEWPKPTRLLHRPELLDHVVAELPDHAPRRFTWRGATHRVVRSDGPERVHGEWWKHIAESHHVRDYFRVEDEEGRRYWLFRRGDGERAVTGDLSWYLHGVFG